MRAVRVAPLALIIVACGAFERDSDPSPSPDDIFTIVTVTTEPSPTPRTEAVSYTVQEGDTLTSIATDFGVSQQAIIDANNLINPDAIQAGQRLSIPPPES